MNKNLKYTKRFINSNFRMKVYGFDENGKRINKFIDRALKAGLDKVVCKLRRGLQVSFYAK